MKPKLLSIVWGATAGLVGLLTIWASLDNFQRSDRKINLQWEKFASQFPKTQTNDSILKLNKSIEKMGFDIEVGKDGKPPLSAAPACRAIAAVPCKNKQSIFPEVDHYLETQIENPNDTVDVPSAILQRYLANHSVQLAAIRTYVLKNKMLPLKVNVNKLGDINDPPLPLILLMQLQQVLALDTLEKNRRGETKEAQESLEVAWKLNHMLWQTPTPYSQVQAVKNSRLLAGVLRKIDELPAHWASRLEDLSAPQFPRSFLLALELYNWESYYSIQSQDSPQWGIPSYLYFFVKPYTKLAALDFLQKTQGGVMEFPKEDICSFQEKNIIRQTKASTAWWNVPGNNSKLDWVAVWSMVARLRLDLEFTQKILQMKALAAKNGGWLGEVPPMPSSVCPDAEWIYQVSTDGTITIALTQKLVWPQQRPRSVVLPLTYSDRQKRPQH